eukprot:scaffold1160_cov261-Pinguiococcus_pyrenoidosus.AAC.10
MLLLLTLVGRTWDRAHSPQETLLHEDLPKCVAEGGVPRRVAHGPQQLLLPWRPYGRGLDAGAGLLLLQSSQNGLDIYLGEEQN